MSCRFFSHRATPRAALALALVYLMTWGGIPVPALAEMGLEVTGILEAQNRGDGEATATAPADGGKGPEARDVDGLPEGDAARPSTEARPGTVDSEEGSVEDAAEAVELERENVTEDVADETDGQGEELQVDVPGEVASGDVHAYQYITVASWVASGYYQEFEQPYGDDGGMLYPRIKIDGKWYELSEDIDLSSLLEWINGSADHRVRVIYEANFEESDGTVERIARAEDVIGLSISTRLSPDSFVYNRGYESDAITLSVRVAGKWVKSSPFTEKEILATGLRCEYEGLSVCSEDKHVKLGDGGGSSWDGGSFSIGLEGTTEFRVKVSVDGGYKPKEAEETVSLPIWITLKGEDRDVFSYARVKFINMKKAMREAERARAQEEKDEEERRMEERVTAAKATLASKAAVGLDSTLNYYLSAEQIREANSFLNLYIAEILAAQTFKPEGLDARLREEAINKILGKLGVSLDSMEYAKSVFAETTIKAKSAEYGDVTINVHFDMGAYSMSKSSSPYAGSGKVTYTVSAKKAVPSNVPTKGWGLVSFADFEQFGKQVTDIADGAIKGVYKVWAGDAAKVVTLLGRASASRRVSALFVDETFSKLVEGQFVKNTYKLLKKPTEAVLRAQSEDEGEGEESAPYKKVTVTTGGAGRVSVLTMGGKEVCAINVQSGMVTSSRPGVVALSNDGETIIYLTSDDYMIRIVAETGTASYSVEECVDSEQVGRFTSDDFALGKGMRWYGFVPAGGSVSAETYEILSDEGELVPGKLEAGESGEPSDDMADIASGIIGGCAWRITRGGTLTIYPREGGDGSLSNPDDPSYINAWPWTQYQGKISHVSIGRGVRAVGSMRCFLYDCSSLTSLDLSGWDTSAVADAHDIFSGCSELSSISIGTSYQIKSADMFPDATAACGKWWSQRDRRWYTKDEIVASRSGIADTYLAYEEEGPDLSKDGWVPLPSGGKGYAKNGKLVTGWMDLGSCKYYFGDDHAMLVGWNDVVVDGKTMHYYFNPASGNLVRDTWFTIEGTNYYFRPSGNLATGWATIKDNGTDKKYYFREDGSLVKDTWYDIDNGQGTMNHYYFRPAGSMATGWATIDGQQYFFRPSGNMATGWADVTNDNGVTAKHYFDEGGVMLVGWQTIGGNTYYFRPSGAMQTGAARIDGAVYSFTEKGVLKKAVPIISANDVTIGIDCPWLLTPVVTPGAGTLSFSSANELVAKVSSSGVVTPVHAGTTTITISTRENDRWMSGSTSITLTVEKGYRSISVEAVDLDVNVIGLRTMSLGGTPIRVKSADGPVTYTKISGSPALSIDANSGKVLVAKGSRAGAYTAQIKVSCQGDSDYEGVYTIETIYVHVGQSLEFGGGLKTYWAIFNEGYRDGRVEASAFDVASGTPYLWWARNSVGAKGLDIGGATLSGKVEQYYRKSDGWGAVAEYSRVSDWASQIIATNMKVYDSNGDRVTRPREIPAANFDGNPYWVMYVNGSQQGRVELVTFDATSPVAARTTWDTSVTTLQAPKNGAANVYLLNAEGYWQRPARSAKSISGTTLVQNASDVIAANVPAFNVDGTWIWKDLSSGKQPLFCW